MICKYMYKCLCIGTFNNATGHTIRRIMMIKDVCHTNAKRKKGKIKTKYSLQNYSCTDN